MTVDQTVAHEISPDNRVTSPPTHADLTVRGMTCRHSPPMVEKALEVIDGVHAAQVNLSLGTAGIDYNPARTSVGDMTKAIRSAGYSPATAKTRLPIKNTHCTPSVNRIDEVLKMKPRVVSASVDLGLNTDYVENRPKMVDRGRVVMLSSRAHESGAPVSSVMGLFMDRRRWNNLSALSASNRSWHKSSEPSSSAITAL